MLNFMKINKKFMIPAFDAANSYEFLIKKVKDQL